MSPEDIAKTLKDARVAKNHGQIDKALKLVTDVVKAEPENLDANWVAAWILASKDDPALAVGQFERAMKLGLKGSRSTEARLAIRRLKTREG